jgi:lipopolysaccharide export system protein LptA
MFSPANKTFVALLLVSVLAPATAADSAAKGISGPINITAKSGEWHNDVMIYTGDVVVTSKTLELHGDRMELRQLGTGRKAPYEITLTGNPATMKHLGEQPGDPVTNGNGSKLVYRTGEQTVDITGNAHLDRGNDELNGEQISYDVPARHVQANGGSKGQVRIVLDVDDAKAEQKKHKDTKP